jgi:hypothetical protein
MRSFQPSPSGGMMLQIFWLHVLQKWQFVLLQVGSLDVNESGRHLHTEFGDGLVYVAIDAGNARSGERCTLTWKPLATLLHLKNHNTAACNVLTERVRFPTLTLRITHAVINALIATRHTVYVPRRTRRGGLRVQRRNVWAS